VAVFFLANRLLPVNLAGRADWEVNAFFMAWGLSVLHAMVRPGRKAWVEQLVLGAALFVAVPLINALTTPWNLGVALLQRDWALAGFDLACLATGFFLAWAAWTMQRAGNTVSVKKPRREKAQPIILEQGTN
jgi:threonine/homoserine/homoserine lactone efflux protein